MRRLYSEPITHEGQLDNLLFAASKNPPRENDPRRARALSSSYELRVHDNIRTRVQIHFRIRNMCVSTLHTMPVHVGCKKDGMGSSGSSGTPTTIR